MSAGVRRRVARLERLIPAHLAGAERKIALHKFAAMALDQPAFEAVIADLAASLAPPSGAPAAPASGPAAAPSDQRASDSGGEPPTRADATVEPAPPAAPVEPPPAPARPPRRPARLFWMDVINKPPNGPRPRRDPDDQADD